MNGRTCRTSIVAAMLLALAGFVVPAASPATTPPCDAVCTRVRAELGSFTGWLAANKVNGYIGEVGWPDGADVTAWQRVAERWYADADAAGLWTTAWATGEWWGTLYPLSVYDDASTVVPGVDRTRPQAAVVEAHRGEGRGVNVAGAEFGSPVDQPTSLFSNTNPGTYGRDWHYDGAATFSYLARRGVRMVRLPFRWERLQPQLGQPLDPSELVRLQTAVAQAGAAGLKVVLDVHNYGAYYLSDGRQGVRRALGSDQVTKAHFADLWSRVSAAFAGNPAVMGYGLMNEPIGIGSSVGLTPARRWEIFSQAAVDAIRARGDATTILVSGYFWSGAATWKANHPKAWIVDPLGRFRYEAHHYFDRDHSGHYRTRYAQELAPS